MSTLSTTLWVVVLPLVQQGPDPEDVKPGWLGFGVFLALAAAVVLLAFSFRKQLRKAKQHFEAEEAGPAEENDEETRPTENGDTPR